MHHDIDYDTTVEGAWREFRLDLADRLSSLDRGDEISVVQSTVEFPEGPHGRLTFTLTSSRRVRCALAAADLHPTDTCRLDEMSRLFGMGWRPLRTRDRLIIIEVPRRRVDELAMIAERTLREIWEVVHPTFLVNDEPAPAIEGEIAVGASPKNADHLRDMVIDALRGLVTARIEVDEEGDILLPTGNSPSWMRMITDQPHIEMCGRIVDGVPDVPAAALFIATNGNRWPDITLHLIGTHVYASLRLESEVFHARNLSSALITWFRFMSDDVPLIRDELANTPEQSEPVASESDRGVLPDTLTAVLYLLDDGPTDPVEVARLCGFDSRTIIDHLKISNRQSAAWRKDSELAEDLEEAAACVREADRWREVMKTLCAALRVAIRHPRRRNAGRDRKSNNS